MSNTNKYGEQNWTDSNVGEGERTSNKDSFLRLNPGSNLVRILTLPYAYYQHKWMPDNENAKKWGYRINCSDPQHRIDCPVCAKGDKPKRKWMVGTIDRKTGQYKILDFGYQIFKDLQTYAKDPDWGVPSHPETGFDVDIVVSPDGGPQNYYSVVPKPKRSLSKSDLMIVENIDSEDLKRRTTPPTREKVQMQFDKIVEELGSEGVVEETTSDTSDDFFRDFDKSK